MNIELFNTLMKHRPAQHPHEWKIFLEICESYLERQKIKNPLVVELGIYENRQKVFWNKLFGAEHIGIDAFTRRAVPDILGNSNDPKTLGMLKEKLKGRPIDILFIDASHWYERVKKDFKMYSPLCNGIVAFHDTNYGRYRGKRANREVWKFWDELKAESPMRAGENKDFLFVSIERTNGTGMMIKR